MQIVMTMRRTDTKPALENPDCQSRAYPLPNSLANIRDLPDLLIDRVDLAVLIAQSMYPDVDTLKP